MKRKQKTVSIKLELSRVLKSVSRTTSSVHGTETTSANTGGFKSYFTGCSTFRTSKIVTPPLRVTFYTGGKLKVGLIYGEHYVSVFICFCLFSFRSYVSLSVLVQRMHQSASPRVKPDTMQVILS